MSEKKPRLQIAIDGPAGAGKSTVARRVAERLGYTYVDTGAMYRALAWAVLAEGLSPEDEAAVCRFAETLKIDLTLDEARTRVLVRGRDITDSIRTPEISNLTSPLSALPCVRRRMVALQQQLGTQGGVVMEGRDIGTVVLPQAAVKVFLTASLEERARRRFEELVASGVAIPMETLQRDIGERDARDSSRDTAPMVPASDATLLDSDHLSMDEVVAAIVRLHTEASDFHGV
jgi:cytidylate kinase